MTFLLFYDKVNIEAKFELRYYVERSGHMRLRNIKGAREDISMDKDVIKKPEDYKGKWKEAFGNENPIHIEIGMGKGQFILQLACENPEINYIGIEKYSSVLIRALQKKENLINEKNIKLDNIFFLRFDADEINNIFDKDEISRIYLNFSDPWPKERHAKRRLTSKEFFAKYNKFLVSDGDVIFKTDNRDLFDFSLEDIVNANWIIREKTYDLYNSEMIKDNIMTEYEERFVSEGKEINKLIAYRN